MTIQIVISKSIPQILLFCFILIMGSPGIEGTTSGSNTLNQSLIFPEGQRADVVLGSLFPIHSSPMIQDNICGPLQGEDGILPLEVLLYTLDRINEDEHLLPGITLGVVALDSCNSPEVALRQSLRFIKGFIASQNTHHEQEFECTNGGTPVYAGGKYDNVFGVIGGQHSSVSIQIANVLRIFKVPQISYRSTSASLSDKTRYPYFLRTVPTDINQVDVIVKILEYLKVSYASLVYSDTEYGIGGYKKLVKKIKNTKICFPQTAFAVRAEDPFEVFQDVMQKLLERKEAKVVIFFGDLGSAVKLLRAAKKKNAKWLWIGSDAWTAHSTALNDFADVIDGSIGIQPLAEVLPGFENYFTNLTPYSNIRNPWFKEYWEAHFGCNLKQDYFCSSNSLKTDGHYLELSWLHFVRDAAYAFASGLHDMWDHLCGPTRGLCQAMAHDGHIHGDQLFSYLEKVSFKDLSNQTFRFQDSGAGTPRYTIFTFKKIEMTKENPWIPIANFSYISNESSLYFYGPPNLIPLAPGSICGKPCSSHQAKIITTDDSCCWICENCTRFEYLDESKKICVSCHKCEEPDAEKRSCIEKKSEYLKYGNQWAITSMAFSCLGIISSLFVGIIFWVHIDTPVIKAASRELSYILLSGIILSFSMTFAILASPSPISCGFTRFFLGFAYTVCYAAILTKTSRIYRIFSKNPARPQKAKYTSPIAQIVIVLLLVSVEVVINASWLTYYNPDVKKICDAEAESNILICKGIDDFSYIVGFIYPLSLVCLCTVFAIKTRKCPGGFNEARYIAFTNYTTCILWLIFVPLYLSTPAESGIRLVALAMSLSLGAFVQLGCLFIPKVHIVLFKPEKNTRDSVMAQSKISTIVQQNSIGRHHYSAPAGLDLEDFDTLPGREGESYSNPPAPYHGRKGSRESVQRPDNGLQNPIFLTVPNLN